MNILKKIDNIINRITIGHITNYMIEDGYSIEDAKIKARKIIKPKEER